MTVSENITPLLETQMQEWGFVAKQHPVIWRHLIKNAEWPIATFLELYHERPELVREKIMELTQLPNNTGFMNPAIAEALGKAYQSYYPDNGELAPALADIKATAKLPEDCNIVEGRLADALKRIASTEALKIIAQHALIPPPKPSLAK